MEIKKLQSLVIDALEDVKAQEIRVFDTSHLTSLFDRIVVASGTSNRQTKALAASVRDKVKENGGNILSVEGEGTGEWVLVDLGDMVVHIMQPAIRAYYRLEEIWGEKEVKLGAAKRVSRTAPDAEEGAAAKKVSRHLTTSQALAPEVDAPIKALRKPRVKSDGTKKAVGKTIKVASSKSVTTKNAAHKAATTPKKAPVRKAPATTKRAPAKPKEEA
ncbi:ribosome silencing factor [Glaciimonas immobilis]|uniref:Ribosomal silencing factor RsfS n=1 Tax=Glaciimonas immobilis TaxID=728004 RepID=A0A840RTU8_9BURK|nr:ribosome silencing factor [Glaciimonas immobilis]KAF3999966.1 ribosome silencing factor [Glaciimonas immobilis]MBB5200468.1 ribosome-associated protein [Glaciimonas immobilis]